MINAVVAQLTGQPSLPKLLAAAEEEPIINTTGVVGAITQYLVPILLAVLGVVFISRAGKGEMSKVLTSSAIAIVGLAFIAGAGALFLFGERLVKLIFG